MSKYVETIQTLAANYGLRLLGAIAILLIGRWLAQKLVDASKKLMAKAQIDETLVSFLGNVLYYLLLVVVIIAALGNLGIATTSVVAVLGAATLAIGLALQDSLGNLAAGVMVILLRPYRAGDFVIIGGETGFVRDIQIFHTTLTTPNNETIFIPNQDALSSNITNYSKEELVRLELLFGIGYEDDLLKAKRLLQELMAADERVAAEPAPSVIVGELADSSVNLVARPYVHVSDMPAVTADMTEQVKLRFDAEGISIPFPQRDVHLFNASG